MSEKMVTRSKHRTEIEKGNIKKRLNVIEGQVRGVSQMISDDRYCDEVLVQIAAIYQSLKSVASEVLKGHMESCIGTSDRDKKVVSELLDLVHRLN